VNIDAIDGFVFQRLQCKAGVAVSAGAASAAGLKPGSNPKKRTANAALKRRLRNCAVPPGLESIFPHLPGTSPWASCRATIVPSLRHWIWPLLFHRRTTTLSFVTGSESAALPFQSSGYSNSAFALVFAEECGPTFCWA